MKKLLSLLTVAALWAFLPAQSYAKDRVMAVSATATASVLAVGAEVHGLVIETGASAGTLTLFDTTSATCEGLNPLTIHTPAGVGLETVTIPGVIRFVNGICAELTNVGGVTIFYK